MKTLLYIHGFNGSPNGASWSKFRKNLPADEWNVIGMDYCQEDCYLALKQIRETIETGEIDIVAGSSLGGFLSLLTFGIRRIVINPCYHPSVELPKLCLDKGLIVPSPEMIRSYRDFEVKLSQFPLEEKSLISGYFANDDELLGDKYQSEFLKDIGPFNIIQGGHHISDDAVKIICHQGIRSVAEI